jgi:hypothetical protein
LRSSPTSGDFPLKLFSALLLELGIDGDIQPIETGGITKLRKKIVALQGLPGYRSKVKSIGIIRDADNNANAAFQSMCSALTFNHLPIPDAQMQKKEELDNPLYL